MPQAGGDLSRLWAFINISPDDRLLVLAWMLEAFRSDTPFPILALTGQQRSAKSNTQSKIRQLIDNNAVNLRVATKSIEDVFVSAGNTGIHDNDWLFSN
jgi:pantothenate kinase-related protein Tda10